MISNLLNKTIKIAFIPATLFGLLTLTDSASAVTLTGSIGISGGSRITEAATTTNIQFINEEVYQADGDFASLLGSTALNVSDLLLNKGAAIPSLGTLYSNSAITSFIDFGFVNLGAVGSGNLTFDLDGAADFVRSTVGRTTIYSNLGGITGVFKFNGDSFATGAVQSSVSHTTSTFQITLETDEPESVPEPGSAAALLALGLVGAVAGAGKAVKRNI
jgi:hypothetical protein